MVMEVAWWHPVSQESCESGNIKGFTAGGKWMEGGGEGGARGYRGEVGRDEGGGEGWRRREERGKVGRRAGSSCSCCSR